MDDDEFEDASDSEASQSNHRRQYGPGDGSRYGVVRAHLPNDQRTCVPAKPGKTVRDALLKAMNMRQLNSDMCTVYRLKPMKLEIDWNTDVSTLAGEEIEVESAGANPYSTSISHNYVRKTFFSLTFCECCHRMLFHGFRCQTCGFRFHQRCATAVPSLCQPLRVDSSSYYEHLLALNDPLFYPNYSPYDRATGSGGGGSSSDGGGSNKSKDSGTGSSRDKSSKSSQAASGNESTLTSSGSSGQLGSQRERSTSAPNVCFNLVNPMGKVVSMNSGQTPFTPSAYYPPPNSAGAPTSPNKAGVQSAGGSPTNKAIQDKQWRPRARSADESSNKVTYSKKAGRESIEDWEIPADEILTGKRIGSGSFGTVYQGHWHGPVALKKLNVINPTPMQLQAFKNEVAVLRKSRHVSIRVNAVSDFAIIYCFIV